MSCAYKSMRGAKNKFGKYESWKNSTMEEWYYGKITLWKNYNQFLLDNLFLIFYYGKIPLWKKSFVRITTCKNSICKNYFEPWFLGRIKQTTFCLPYTRSFSLSICINLLFSCFLLFYYESSSVLSLKASFGLKSTNLLSLKHYVLDASYVS